MRSRVLTLAAALLALAVIPSTALAAPKKVQFRFGATAYSTGEGNKTFNVTVERSGNTSVPASASVTDNGTGSAATPANYSFTPATVNFAANQTQATVPVTITDNTLFEANHTIVLKLTGVTPSGTNVKTPTTTITILENDGPGTIDLSSPTYSVVESAGVATVTINRNTSATNLTESVDYTTTQLVAGTGHATAGIDYMTSSGTVTFTGAQTTKSFQVPVLDDSLYEGAETLNVTLSNARNLTNPGQAPNLGPSSPATLTIVDDDVPTFSFSQPTFSVNEPAGTATVTVTRGGATNIPATVAYSRDGSGTASSPADYTLTAGTLSFAAGQTTKTFSVSVVDDGLQEGNETIGLQLTDVVSGDQIATATLSIVDDDNPSASIQFSDVSYSVNEGTPTATITATLSKAVNSTVTVHYATSDQSQTATNNPATADTTGPAVQNDYAPASGTLTFAPTVTTQTFTVPIHQDTSIEGDETLNLALSSPSGALLGAPSTAVLTIVDDDLAGKLEFDAVSFSATETDAIATVMVHRVLGSKGPVSIDYETSDGTAGAPDDYASTSGTLNFADGDTALPINIPVVWDGRAEGTETINIALSNVSGADMGSNATAVIRLADDGASGPVQFATSSYNAGEGDGTVTVNVTRSGGSLGGPVTVDYATTDGTAVDGSDYTATNGTLTFGPAEVTKSFTVAIANDSVHEDNKTFQVTLSNPGGGVILGSPATTTVNIADDDAAPVTPGTGTGTDTGAGTSTGSGTPASPQSTPANPDPAGSQTAPADKRAPKLSLSAKKVQKAFKVKLLALAAKCDENCALTVVAKVGTARKAVTLGQVKAKTARGVKAQIKIKLSKKVLAKLTKSLKRGKAKISIAVLARDAAGNQSKASRAITVRL